MPEHDTSPPALPPALPLAPVESWLHRLRRAGFFLLAWLSLALGVAGVFIPGLPTTVFILLSAWFATRSSPRLLAWLEAHQLFGPMIRDWRAGGRVSRKAKKSAAIVMSLCAVLLFLTAAHVWVAVLVSLLMLTIWLWLWRRPEPDEKP